jgi:hypothetical protein
MARTILRAGRIAAGGGGLDEAGGSIDFGGELLGCGRARGVWARRGVVELFCRVKNAGKMRAKVNFFEFFPYKSVEK